MTDRPKLMPADTPDYMAPAWLGALHWAIQRPEFLDRFSKETYTSWRPGLTHHDRMIDRATGADQKFIEAFIAWFNVNVWGAVGENPQIAKERADEGGEP